MNTEQMLSELAKLDKLAENRNINKTHMYGRFFEKHRDYFLASIASQAKSVPDDAEHEITIDRRDLFDFLRAKIKSVLDDYSNESQAANWSTATDLTVKAFENLHVAAPQQADKVWELLENMKNEQYKTQYYDGWNDAIDAALKAMKGE